MIKHHRIAWHIGRIRPGHLERVRPGLMSALRNWLPVIAAEAMLLASFLLWLHKSDAGYHGLAMVFIWIIYGLIALTFMYLWIEPAEED
ncbi:MAG TPA: hypothetical protein VNH42_06170 [Mariprofundaceae bacterium]|nr:hypothetical protein [Mariprofundaceae bacterium]